MAGDTGLVRTHTFRPAQETVNLVPVRLVELAEIDRQIDHAAQVRKKSGGRSGRLANESAFGAGRRRIRGRPGRQGSAWSIFLPPAVLALCRARRTAGRCDEASCYHSGPPTHSFVSVSSPICLRIISLTKSGKGIP